MIKINNVNYEVIKDYGDCLNTVDLNEIVTDYYDAFDYIEGDFAYGKVRLKGFYDSSNKLKKDHNDIKNVDDYLQNCCAYGCKHFILHKTKEDN